MGTQIELKGVRLTADGLSSDARRYLEGKARRLRRRARRERSWLHRLFRSFLPDDWKRIEIESYLRGCGRVLVVGCSAGLETLGLQAANDLVAGFDVDLAALRLARELRVHAGREHAGARFLAASGDSLPFRDGCFDAALADNVVEHLPDGPLRRHLREMRRVLRSGGTYLFTTPNAVFEPVPDPGHVSLHTYAEWEGLLREAGFVRIQTPRRRSGPFGDLEWKKRRERASFSWGAGNLGLKMVTLRATAP